MIDIGHEQTEKVLESIERRLAREYAQSYKEVEKKAADYFARFAEKDKKKKALVDAGKLSEKEYQTWRKNQMLTGKRWTDLRDQLAKDLTNTNQIAAGIVRGELDEVFAINANYSEYLIENGMRTNYGFTLYDRNTIANLAKNDPDIIPWKPKVDVPADLRWNRQMVTSHITQGILQGESIPNLSKRLLKTVNNDKVAAVRTARTAVTSSQNAGRQMVYDRAEKMGLKLQKEWLATLDGRTRHEHGAVDGQKVPLDGEFTVGGYKMKYPGDMSAPPHLTWNCRCTTITVEPDYITKGEDPRMTYSEWIKKKGGKDYEKYQKEKEKVAAKEPEKSAYMNKPQGWRRQFMGEDKEADVNIFGTDILSKNYERHRKTNNLTLTPYDEMKTDGLSDNIVYANYGKISDNVASKFNVVISDLSQKYDTPLQTVRTMTKEEFLYHKDSFAFVSHDYTVDSATLVINPIKCKDSESLISKIKSLSEYRYCIDVTEGKELEYVVTHEFAHTLANMKQKLSAKSNWVGANYEKVELFRSEINYAYNEYVKEIAKLEEKRMKLEKTIDTFTDSDEIMAALEKLDSVNDEIWKIKLSDYSMADADEFMAEGFTNAIIGKAPNKYSNVIIKIVGRYFGRG